MDNNFREKVWNFRTGGEEMLTVIIEKDILDLEERLIQPEVRQSPQKIAELISDDCIEFCSSGTIYSYNVGDVFDVNKDLSVIDWEIKDFSIKILSDDVVLATYKATKNNKLTKESKHSLRSSIWKTFNGNWKMIFHQGTLIKGGDNEAG